MKFVAGRLGEQALSPVLMVLDHQLPLSWSLPHYKTNLCGTLLAGLSFKFHARMYHISFGLCSVQSKAYLVLVQIASHSADDI